jgi:hypothetical protein
VSMFDAFPESHKEQKIDEWLKPGAIVYLTCSFVMKPFKDKYLVIASVQPECIMFMINTEARRVTVQTQVQLNVADYPGQLTCDCFINCNKVITEFELPDIRAQILADGGRYKSRLRAVDQQQVLAALKFSTDIPLRQQKMIIAALQTAP